MCRRIRVFFSFILLLSPSLFADELNIDPPKIWDAECLPCRPPADCLPPPPCLPDLDDNVVVDLMNPLYENGVLSTCDGGVLCSRDLRIQAQKIVYTRCLDDPQPVFTVSCEGNLLIDYKQWILLGDAFYYDFLTHTGYLINGRTASPPWYVGGREFMLLRDGNIMVIDGYLSTSEGQLQDVVLRSPTITLTPDQIVSASNLNLWVKKVPVFWFPYFKYDLKNTVESPFGVKFGWGGFKGSHLSVLYRFLAWKEFYATARLDAFFGHGLGGGVDTEYDPKCRPTKFYTRNYYAHDIPLLDPKSRNRYRFQGTYFDRLGPYVVDAMYDAVSDAEMATDYQTKDFELFTAGRTQFEIKRRECGWLANLFTRVRVNKFQSVNQEIPSFYYHLHPVEIPTTGIIAESIFKASYLNYVFSEDVLKGENIHSGRIACYPKFYRPFYLNALTATPEAGLIGIAYSNSQSGSPVGQLLGNFGLTLEMPLSKPYGNWKHVFEPYIQYRLLTHPRVATGNHFIFTINDGYDKLNIIRFGGRNSIFVKTPCGIFRPLWIDLWANAYIDTPTVRESIPKGYVNLEWEPFRRIYVHTEGAWNFQHTQLDFVNTGIDYTVNQNIAFGVEYRHRGRFDWRKADFYNFILESVRSEEILLDSALSDKRNTFLFRTFLRPSPDWTIKFDLRNGFGREEKFDPDDGLFKKQPTYLEFQIEASTLVFQHWRLTFNYEKRVKDNRFSFSMKLDPGPPPKSKACR